jgi:hypothetical protein
MPDKTYLDIKSEENQFFNTEIVTIIKLVMFKTKILGSNIIPVTLTLRQEQHLNANRLV